MNKYTALSSLIILALGIIFSIYSQYFTTLINYVLSQHGKSEKIFLPEKLKLYNGVDAPQLYLAILGNVFDVTKGAKHYGPGETYNVFIGRDASRSFVTGKFNEADASDDLTGLSKQEVQSLNKWLEFYNKEYTKVGKLVGRYYDSDGKRTQYYKEIRKIIKVAAKEKHHEDMEKLKYPPCNVEWDVDRGTRVWCTNRSGGIERNWVGVPRKLYEPGSESFRCACVKLEDLHLKTVEQYEDCDPNFEACFVKT